MIDYDRSFKDVLVDVGARAKQLRLFKELRQDELAERAGVGVATVIRFEKSGMASMESVVRIAMALRAESGFEGLFKPPAYKSIDDALARPIVARRERAPRKK